MSDIISEAKTISVDRIFLDLENPRHEPYQNQAQVIEYLCRDEYVYQLAKDIAKHGLNPLELFALIPMDVKKGKGKTQSYVVAEGNRRMCAIMLLNDPELAPAKQRKDFQKLSEQAGKISEVFAVAFDDKKSVDMWLERIHGGIQGGVGRKQWNAEQKTRHLGDKKNILAQAVLDYAEKNKFISSDDRKGRLTTVQRYLSNAMLREALGIDGSNIEDVSRNRPKPDFDQLLRKFVKDLLSGTVNSRSNSDKIIEYSRSLSALDGLTGKRTAVESLAQEPNIGGGRKKRKSAPKHPDKRKFITYETEINEKLKSLSSFKLEQIYWSLCSIELDKHAPLLSVGTWSFFESLTAKAGRSGTDFLAFLSNQKLHSLGFSKSDETRSIRQAIERISHYGNTTKHHEGAANFNGAQLANDMDTLKLLICTLAEDAQKKP